MYFDKERLTVRQEWPITIPVCWYRTRVQTISLTTVRQISSNAIFRGSNVQTVR
jgi:hypothetical protein